MQREQRGGGYSLSNQSSSSAESGNSGDIITNSADRVSKQFINSFGAGALDAGTVAGASAGFWSSVSDVQSDQQPAMVKYALIGGGVLVTLVGLALVIKRGR